jgi:hypothetical protein
MTPVLVDLGAVPAGTAVAGIPLAQNPQPPPGQGEEFGKASPVAAVVIVLLALATIALVRNMTTRIKRLPPSFDTEREDEREGEGGGEEPGGEDDRRGR